MISLITILLFFVYTWGFGYSITKFFNNSEDFFERNLMRIGIGLGVFVVFGTLLNLLHIPLDWRFFLVLSMIVPILSLTKNIKNHNLSFPKLQVSLYEILLLSIFFLTLFMYIKGAFVYPWLEDDDPWVHAYGSEYISIEKTLYEPYPDKQLFNYLDAYPPAYDLIMGILHQTSSSIQWTLKFFNCLIISFSLILFYYFMVHFMKSKKKAIFSTFILAIVPSYLSHFIWAHSLVPFFFFVIIYCIEMMQKNDAKWKYSVIILVASLCMTQPTQPVKIAVIIGIYIIVKSLINKKFMTNLFFACLFGLILSIILWWGPMLVKYKSDFMEFGLGQTETARETGINYIGPLGSATRLYTFSDFFIAKSQNMINNPVGLGIFVCSLLIISIILIIFYYKNYLNSEKDWVIISLLWLLFTFMGLYGGTVLPVALESFQFWMLFAIMTSIVLGEGFYLLVSNKNRIIISTLLFVLLIFSLIYSNNSDYTFPFKSLFYFISIMFVSSIFVIQIYNLRSSIKIDLKVLTASSVVFIFFFGIILTSGYQKYQVNTAQWGPGGLLGIVPGLTEGYIWFKDIPTNTKVYPMANTEAFLVGVDKTSCGWCKEVLDFRNQSYNYNANELYTWLKNQGYEYLIIDNFYAEDYGVNKTNERLGVITPSNKFSLSYKTQSAFIFKII
jgi:hypothetical protein